MPPGGKVRELCDLTDQRIRACTPWVPGPLSRRSPDPLPGLRGNIEKEALVFRYQCQVEEGAAGALPTCQVVRRLQSFRDDDATGARWPLYLHRYAGLIGTGN